MKKKIRFIILFVIIILFLSFLSLVIQSQNIGMNGGTFCDEGKDKYCWVQIPYWYCLPTGYYACSDPVKPLQE